MGESLQRAIDIVGSQAALAELFGLKPQAVQQWQRVPAERVLEVARATGWRVKPHELRPDLYPHPEDGMPRRLRGRRSS